MLSVAKSEGEHFTGTSQGNCRLTLPLLSSSASAYLQVSLIDNSSSGLPSSFTIVKINAPIFHKIFKIENQNKCSVYCNVGKWSVEFAVTGRQFSYKLACIFLFPENHNLITCPHSPTLTSFSVLKTLPKKKHMFVSFSNCQNYEYYVTLT